MTHPFTVVTYHQGIRLRLRRPRLRLPPSASSPRSAARRAKWIEWRSFATENRRIITNLSASNNRTYLGASEGERGPTADTSHGSKPTRETGEFGRNLKSPFAGSKNNGSAIRLFLS